MDEIELFVMGAIFTISLAVIESRVREITVRALLDLSALPVLLAGLYLLRLSVTQDAADFLSADGGVVLVAGAFGIGGLLPAARTLY